MTEKSYEPERLQGWAREHWKEWEIVCGIRNSSMEMNAKIARMLKEAEFFELAEMMTLRTYQLMLDTWEAEGEVEVD